MPADYYLKIDGVEGESTEEKHKGEIVVNSFSWGETQISTAAEGKGSGAGKVERADFQFTKRMDKSSPVLFMACANGKHFPKAVLTARKAGEGQQDYLKMTMQEVFITSFSTIGSEGDPVPHESIGMSFKKLEISYKEQTGTGTLGAEVKQTYDFTEGKKV
jgi:type VI secretion system secreted protein Hcp